MATSTLTPTKQEIELQKARDAYELNPNEETARLLTKAERRDREEKRYQRMLDELNKVKANRSHTQGRSDEKEGQNQQLVAWLTIAFMGFGLVVFVWWLTHRSI